MSLSSIRAELAADLNIRIETASEKTFLNDKINKAAEEIFEKRDLRNSLREQLFVLTTNQQLITLPSYVYRLRKVRNYDFSLPVNNIDLRPRYSQFGWYEQGLKFRVVQENAALQRDIENQGPITLTLSEAASAAFAVTITGKTANADRVVEVLVFNAGDTTKTTTKSWEDIESIEKSAITNENLVVADMDGNQISAISNAELIARFMKVQVLERFEQFAENPIYEVLYKVRFNQFKNDGDNFQCGNEYDKAIYWKVIELMAAKQDGDDAMKRVIGAQTKCEQVINDIERNAADGQSKRLEFSPCPFYDLFSRPTLPHNLILD